MNKQINLIINGKGGVGKSFFATNFVSVSQRLRHRPLRNRQRPRKRHSQALHRSGHARCRKDIELSSFGLRRRAAPLFESSKTLLPFPEMQPSRVALPAPHLRKLRRALHSDNA
jgi:hypothetical protein